MAISPPSDIVLDVARAVEPCRPRGGARRTGQADGGASAAAHPLFSLTQAISNRAAPSRQPGSRRRTASSASRRWCCRPSSRTCCRRTPKASTARAWQATCGSRCWPSIWPASWPSAAASASPDRCSRDHYIEGEKQGAHRRGLGGPETAEIDHQARAVDRAGAGNPAEDGTALAEDGDADSGRQPNLEDRTEMTDLFRIRPYLAGAAADAGSRSATAPGQPRRHHRPYRGGGRRRNRGDPHRYPASTSRRRTRARAATSTN